MGKQKVNPRKLAGIIIGLILVILILIKGLPFAVSVIFGHSISEECKTITPDAISTYDFDTYKNEILLFNSQGLKSYNSKGDYMWDIPAKVYEPYLYTQGNYAVLADKGGSEIYHVNGTENDFTIKSNQPVQAVSVNENGYTVVISSERGYKSLVSVYDNNGQEQYKWYSGEIYVSDAKISPDNKKMAIIGVDVNKSEISNVAMFFDLNSENPKAQVILDNVLAYQLMYVGHDVAVLTDSSLMLLKSNGEIKKTYDFKGRALHAFDIKNPSNMVLALSQESSKGGNTTNSEIVVLNNNLSVKGKANVPVEVTMIDENSDTIAAGGQRELFLLTAGGRLLTQGHMVKDAKHLKITKDKRHIVTLSGSLINIYNIRLGR